MIDTSGQICEMHFEDGNRKKLPSKFFVDDEWVELQDNNKVRIVLEFEDGETDQFCRVCLVFKSRKFNKKSILIINCFVTGTL